MGAELTGLLVVLVVLVVLYQRRRNAEPLILGQQLARAHAVEEERLKRGTSAPSPMPKEEYTARHSNLTAPQPIPLDAAIRDVVARYRTADEQERAVIRDSITAGEQYTLSAFANRAAVFGIRERDPAWIESGLTAVAMFDMDRMDWRDTLLPAELLHHAACRIEMDTERLFTETAALAEARIAKGIAEYAKWKESRLGHQWPREEIATGFVDRGPDHYAPTRDLTGAIIRIGDMLDADGRHEVSGVTIGQNLDPVWIHDSGQLLKKARGGASIHTGLYEGVMVFLLEAADAAAAATLHERVSRQMVLPNRVIVSVARGELFCLLIGDAPETLDRFIAPVTEILDTTL